MCVFKFLRSPQASRLTIPSRNKNNVRKLTNHINSYRQNETDDRYKSNSAAFFEYPKVVELYRTHRQPVWLLILLMCNVSAKKCSDSKEARPLISLQTTVLNFLPSTWWRTRLSSITSDQTEKWKLSSDSICNYNPLLSATHFYAYKRCPICISVHFNS